ncbi:hypothetical protein [Streptomyces sp. NBC_01546]|uniref:hypothetical protein n=1 Tax=Streptomyces sp. NBC_01546 TaxID=2975872 RepID=UPI003870323C
MNDDDEHSGYSAHVTWLDIDKPGLWPGARPATEGPAPAVRSAAPPACHESSAIYAAQLRQVARSHAN